MKPLFFTNLRETVLIAPVPQAAGGMLTESLQLFFVSAQILQSLRCLPGLGRQVLTMVLECASPWRSLHASVSHSAECVYCHSPALFETEILYIHVSICSTWHLWSLISLEGVKCESYKKHIERWWGKGCPALTTSVTWYWKNAPVNQHLLLMTLQFLKSTSFAKEHVRFNHDFTWSWWWW